MGLKWLRRQRRKSSIYSIETRFELRKSKGNIDESNSWGAKIIKRGKRVAHVEESHEKDSNVEGVSPKPARGSKRRDEGFDKQPQRLMGVATFSR
jgi:hypothetical protein